jgi:two-component system, OmpR family, sensor histidine kinase KdpD
MAMLIRQNWVGCLTALCGVALMTIFYRFIFPEVNTTTVALSFLLVVLAAASAYGLLPGIMGAVVGMLCFNFFFLPPHGTLTVQDPQNWMALFTFLVTAIIASQLSSAARARARDADKRREEVWKLYKLSRAIIATPDSETNVSSIARQVVDVFEFNHFSVFKPDMSGRWERLAHASEAPLTPAESEIANAYFAGEMKVVKTYDELKPTSKEQPLAIAYTPLKVGVKPMGVMVLASPSIERGTVEAIAGLVALALERARFLKEISRSEAIRQSDELKSALLASVSHDLRTPLTSIRAAIDSLLLDEIEWSPTALREFHLIISEEVQRLTNLVQNLLEMARIDAGELNMSRRWGSVSEVFTNVLERTSSATRDHRVCVDLDENLPLMNLDSRLIAQVLTNLVENAAKYSPTGAEIVIKGEVDAGNLILSVADEGEGILPDEQAKIFDKFYRSTRSDRHNKEGTGMGLAIARGIIEAHGGRIWVESTPEQGSKFSLAIPVELKDAKVAMTAEEA